MGLLATCPHCKEEIKLTGKDIDLLRRRALTFYDEAGNPMFHVIPGTIDLDELEVILTSKEKAETGESEFYLWQIS